MRKSLVIAAVAAVASLSTMAFAQKKTLPNASAPPAHGSFEGRATQSQKSMKGTKHIRRQVIGTGGIHDIRRGSGVPASRIP
jgi:uncharacterized protein YdeI (BOF family)